MKRTLNLLVLFLCLSSLSVRAQDLHFSQFFETPLDRNPALAGIVNGDVRVQTVYRSQWNSVANAYKTASLNGEYKLPVKGDDFVTLGMQVLFDKAGSTSLTTTHLLPAVNYHKSLSSERNLYLSVGFMGGLVQRSLDRSRISTTSSYEGRGDGENNLQSQYSYFDGSVGTSLNAQIGENEENNLVLGVAYHHFNKPRNSFYNNENIIVQPKWVYSADLKMALNETSFVSFHNDHVRQGTYSETISGFLYGLKVGGYSESPEYIIKAGAFMRWQDAVIPVIQIDYKPFTVSLSYDVTVSRLSKFSYGQGGYELALRFTGFLDRDNSSANAVLCPRF
ncbi:MAG TPA: PorP/SprF family type IX secretion system membrane protein [Flavisolibacter sp.]|jgi:type IX secretion system PorP/SprF family membrane protein|nr:PorP/SprF family type IX secretion system membrane protein [Flavisolibacter sp.]